MNTERLSLFEFDGLYENRPLCGVDEAGRGPLAGDVYAAAVVLSRSALDSEIILNGLNDSKKLTAKKREILFDEIKKHSIWCVARASVAEIDEINILRATHLAMKRAIEGVCERIEPKTVLIDGNSMPEIPLTAYTIVKGDARSACIAAASILAKVSRDRAMVALHEKYPQYNFEKHKGYGTAEHVAALKAHGVCEIHRKSFMSKILPEQFPPKKTAKREFGDHGEDAACELLEREGYKIVARNWRCREGEIDIIAQKDYAISIIEVKTRMKDKDFPAEGAVGYTKSRKLSRAIDAWMAENPGAYQLSFDIITLEIDRKTGDRELKHIKNAFPYISL